MINDDDAINKEIVRVLSKGPERVRVLSREELRMEIKKLNNEIQALKAGGATKKKKRKLSTEKSEDQALEQSFDNITFDKYKELKEQMEQMKAELDTKQKELDDAKDLIEDLKDEKKANGISLHAMMEKVQNMDTDKLTFERVKLKLKEFKNTGLFKGVELDVDEEEDDETINLMNRLNKLLDKTKEEIEKRDAEQQKLQKILEVSQKEKLKEVDELVDEYNTKDEQLKGLTDKYIALQKEMK